MKIDLSYSNGNTAYVGRNKISPSFTAVHPSKYFIKNVNGDFVHVDSPPLIKKLQRQLIGYLNSKNNKPKKESPSEKTLRERLIRFFNNRDIDYRENNIVRSVYNRNRFGQFESYILTGDTVGVAHEDARLIGEAQGILRDKVRETMLYYDINEAEAKKLISRSDYEYKSSTIQRYYNNITSYIRKTLSVYNKKNSNFEAYFVPTGKGKHFKYELVNATMNGK